MGTTQDGEGVTVAADDEMKDRLVGLFVDDFSNAYGENDDEAVEADLFYAQLAAMTVRENTDELFRALGYKKHGPIKKGAYSVCCCDECGPVWRKDA